MKRTIAIILFLITSVFCFAETGYDGVEWQRQRSSLNFGDKADSWRIKNNEVMSFGTNILGRTTIKSYFFFDEKLEGVGYYFLMQDLDELLQRFEDKKKIYEIKTQTDLTQGINYLLEQVSEEYPEYAKEDESGLDAFILVVGEMMALSYSNVVKEEGYKSIEEYPEATGKLYIYDYNDDTRVYIITEGLEGLGFVTYLQHFKDY